MTTTQTNSGHNSGNFDVDVIIGSNEIFMKGIDLLKHGDHSRVCIYAPTGAWVPDNFKLKWFWIIASCLANALPETGEETTRPRYVLKHNRPAGVAESEYPSTKLESFVGVYGLPPIESTRRGLFQLQQELTYLKELLRYFEGIPTAHLRFLRVDTNTIPGTGGIIIDDNIVFLGFATGDPHKVNFGVMIQDHPASTNRIASHVQTWFSDHIMEITRDNILQELSRDELSAKDRIERFGAVWWHMYLQWGDRFLRRVMVLILIVQAWALYFLVRDPLEKSSEPEVELVLSVIAALYVGLIAITGILGAFFALLIVGAFLTSYFVPNDLQTPIQTISGVFGIFAGLGWLWRYLSGANDRR